MSSTIPLDPYATLSVAKDAKLPEIRSAHRKLVLKCHPDKVQDPALKAIKQDEFQKVQQAYELLSDDAKRLQYDEQVKLVELRKEMGRSGGSSSRNTYEFDVRSAEPREATYKQQSTKESSKVYERTPPRSYEDEIGAKYDETSRASARKAASYDSKRPSVARDEERKSRRADEERERDRWEKESRRSGHGERRKTRDKERKKGSEDKYTNTRATYVESDDSEDDYRQPTTGRSMRNIEQEIRAAKEEQARAARASKNNSVKYDMQKDLATQYMQAAHQKVQKPMDDNDFVAPPRPRRAETFQEPSYHVRYAPPPISTDDLDTPRRSSGRRASDAVPARSTRESTRPSTKEKDRKASSRRDPDPYVVDAPFEPPTSKKPSLQSYSSAPPLMPVSSSSSGRREPHRSKTMQSAYTTSRKDPAAPSLPRAATLPSGLSSAASQRPPISRGFSRLKEELVATSSESESSDASDSEEDRSPMYRHTAPRTRAVTPPPVSSRRRGDAERVEATRYIIDNGRTVPVVTRHRADVDMAYSRGRDREGPRDRSESPQTARPPLARSTPSSATATRSGRAPSSQSQAPQQYYPPSPPDNEPIIMTVRPKMATRESSRGHFADVKYAPSFRAEDVSYSRRGSGAETASYAGYANAGVSGGRERRGESVRV